MRLVFCPRCGESHDFEKIKRKIFTDIIPNELRPSIHEEYQYQCKSCLHFIHIVDTNYEPE